MNRIPADNGTIDAYLCGNCLVMWDEEHDLLIVDGVLGFESTTNEDSVMSILEDRANNATLPEERIAARHRLDKARAYYTSNEWMSV